MRCEWCKNELNDDAKFCQSCGATVAKEEPQPVQNNAQTNYQQPVENTNFQNQPATNTNGKANIGLVILSFFIPIAGLIVFLVKKDDDKKTAKASGLAALISVGINILLTILVLVLVYTGTKNFVNNAIDSGTNSNTNTNTNTTVPEVDYDDTTNNDDKINNTQNSEINLTSEQAFKMIESKRKELGYNTWSTGNAKVIKKGDNNYYWVIYTEVNIEGYDTALGVIFHYENGEWKFEIPGFSGTSGDEMAKYNFVDVNSSEYFELNDDLSFALIESKRKELGYNTWSTKNAKVIKKGDNNYYWVTYTEANVEGYDTALGVIFHYENGEWKFEIPGFSGTSGDEMAKYNFVDVE